MIIAKNRNKTIELLPQMANRHGLIVGSTGSGKTITLRVIAEQFSKIGVPVFLADVKGDLSGIAVAGNGFYERATAMELPFEHRNYPVLFWDVFGKEGHPLRTTIADLGPLLIARLLDLNKVQTGVITLAFKVCHEYLKDSILLNTKDLKYLLKHLADNAYDYTTDYGNINYTSVGAIQRAILELEVQGVNELFNLPKFDITDFFVTGGDGRGVIHILNAKIIINQPKLYTTFLLWLLSELYARLPERGDRDKPLFIFMFDEAHLLFKDISKVLLDKIESIIRLIRSKGVGIYFVTQSPLDIPKTVLGQLGNRIQHTLRAFTPEDFNAVNKIAKTFRPNIGLNINDSITSMGTGEALVSLLQADGTPAIVEKAWIVPPESRIEPLTSEEINLFVTKSPIFGKYETKLYKDSDTLKPKNDPRVEKFASNFGRGVVRTMGNQVGREIIRGIFHTFFKGVRSGVGK